LVASDERSDKSVRPDAGDPYREDIAIGDYPNGNTPQELTRNSGQLARVCGLSSGELLFLGEQDDFPGNLGAFEHLVGAGCFAKREFFGDDRLDSFVRKQAEEFG
jgi:hypothetical protein